MKSGAAATIVCGGRCAENTIELASSVSRDGTGCLILKRLFRRNEREIRFTEGTETRRQPRPPAPRANRARSLSSGENTPSCPNQRANTRILARSPTGVFASIGCSAPTPISCRRRQTQDTGRSGQRQHGSAVSSAGRQTRSSAGRTAPPAPGGPDRGPGSEHPGRSAHCFVAPNAPTTLPLWNPAVNSPATLPGCGVTPLPPTVASP